MKKIIFLYVLAVTCFLSNCSFQISLFTEMNHEYGGKNLILSPLSAFQILSLATNGACADTQQEMIDTLTGIELGVLNDLNLKIKEIMEHFVSVEQANGIMTRIKTTDTFKEIYKYYEASVEQLIDARQVNKWCYTHTHGNITEIIKELDPNTMLILLNAVFFQGEWLYPFNPKYTTTKPFFNFNQEQTAVKAETMTQTIKCPYYEDDIVQAVELPYKKDGMSAIIILPRKEYDINDLINSEKINDELIYQIINHYKTIEINLELPKFELGFEGSLKKALEIMGMNLAFTQGLADFKELSYEASELELYIADVLHKTYLKVDELGTVAAGVTMVDFQGRSLAESIDMQVNRPFIMVIRSDDLPKDYDILFISKIEEIN